MKITLERQNKAVHMKAFNEEGASISIDGAAAIGGENKGLRPMQLLLAAIGGCSIMDIVSIMNKQKQPLEDIRVVIEGERERDKVPSLFEKIHVHFILTGNFDEKKAKRAIDLSTKTYCSVSRIIEKTAHISYTYEIIHTKDAKI
jgi:putative redox protein